MLLLFPGDVFSREAAPPLDALSFCAAAPAILTQSTVAEEAWEAGAQRAIGSVSASFARLTARTALHAMMLSELTAEQRLATFLLELALRFGTRTPAGSALELPLSRTDMAHYLSLNPDTMSRVMSRLKARGLIATPSRGCATVPDLGALAKLSPLASALQRLWPSDECGPDLGREPTATS